MSQVTPQLLPVADGADRPLSLKELFVQEEPRLLRFARSLVGDDTVAQDLVQEAFLRLHRQATPVHAPRAWLCQVIRRMAIDRLRRARETGLEAAGVEGQECPDDEIPGPGLDRKEAVAALRLQLADLPERDRELLRLKFEEELDYARIAGTTGMSVGNVGFRLHHLLRRLAAQMKDCGS